MNRLFLLCSLLCGFAATSCQEYDSPSLSAGQRKKVEAHKTKDAVTPEVTLNAIIEDQIKVLGYDLNKKVAAPGEKVTVTWYLQALKPIEGDPMMFVHFQGQKGDSSAWQNLDHHPIDGLMPIRQLAVGEIVKDVQTFTVRDDFTLGDATLYMGFFKGNHRMQVKAEQGKVDSEGRIIGPELTIKGKKGKSAQELELKTATAIRMRNDEKVIIDGKLDEPIWQRARPTHAFTAPNGSGRESPDTRARFAWDSEALYVAVVAVDDDIWSTFTERDANTWEQEVIELFIDADGDKKDYLELQVTPANVVFDARFARYRSDLETARAWNMKGFETAVDVTGTLNQRDDRDEKYTVEMRIPFDQVPGAQLPIAHDTTWRFNMFRFDMLKNGRQVAGAFCPPIKPDFHNLERFGILRFLAPSEATKLEPGTDVPAAGNPAPIENSTPAENSAPADAPAENAAN